MFVDVGSCISHLNVVIVTERTEVWFDVAIDEKVDDGI